MQPGVRAAVVFDGERPLGGVRVEADDSGHGLGEGLCGEGRVPEGERAVAAVLRDHARHERVRGPRHDLLGGRVLVQHAAGAEDGDLVAEDERLVDVVRHEHDGLLELALQADHLLLQFVTHDGVDGAERLVHEQDGRVGREGTGHAHALLLPAGQVRGVAVHKLGAEADTLDGVHRLRARLLRGHALEAQHGRDVVEHRAVREEARVLDDVADAKAQLRGRNVGDVLARDRDASTRGVDHLVDHAHRRGLAAATRADEGCERPFLDVEAEVVDRGGAVRIRLGDALEGDHAAPWLGTG